MAVKAAVLPAAPTENITGTTEKKTIAKTVLLISNLRGFAKKRFEGGVGTGAGHQADGALGVGVEAVDADHRVDTGFPDDPDHVDHVLATLFHQFQVLLGVDFIHGDARGEFGAAAVHFERPDGGGEHGYVWFQAPEAGFNIPELLKGEFSYAGGVTIMNVCMNRQRTHLRKVEYFAIKKIIG